MRNTGGNKYETTAGEIQFDQFSTFFEKPKMTSRKVTPTAVNVKVKKILTTFSCPLACVGTNLAAICPMEVRLPSEKLILPYFSSPRGVATLDCDSHSQAGSTKCPMQLFVQSGEIGFLMGAIQISFEFGMPWKERMGCV